ncbi:hypothetical protein ACAW74_21015 [Fibrella sp. WM1]|uniref:hypothetical protein n=1 Tax=Fibrella musci TaxID=3242485 RepID=UPI003520B327
MSKLIMYGLLCEDLAHKTFLQKYFATCFPETFLEEENFGWRIKASNAKEVDDSIADAARQGFARYGLDILVVGRDADTTDKVRIEKLKDSHRNSCATHLKRVVFMIPIQCIEHWLLYIKRHTDNPTATKNETLETIPRLECKRSVYGETKKAPKQAEIASTILANFDVDWLEQRSESFKEFHHQVKAFLEAFSA